MEVGAHKQRKGYGYTFVKRKCDICGEIFTMKSPQNTHCSKRCAYIATKLTRKAAEGMDRDTAIAYYGNMYDDPLRHIRRGLARQYIRCIMLYCKEKSTIFVSAEDLERHYGKKLSRTSMATVERKVPALTFFAEVLMDDGTKRIIYRFLEEDLLTNEDVLSGRTR